VAASRHKRDTDARRKPSATTVAGSLAVLATGAAVLAGVSLQTPSSSSLVADDASSSASVSSTPSAAAAPAVTDRDHAQLSRSMNREELAREAARARAEKARAAAQAAARRAAQHTVPRWTTTALNIWTEPGDGAKKLDVLPEDKKIAFAQRTVSGRDEVVIGGAIRWVTTGYLSKDKPVETGVDAGLSDAPCPDSSVEDGLAADTIRVYRSVCHAFPQVTDYLGWGPRVEHDTGHAIDVMVYGDKALGDEIAAWAQAHASELNLYDVIWYDRIWTPVRASEGWRDYGDHGSPTANHMDHVHIGTN